MSDFERCGFSLFFSRLFHQGAILTLLTSRLAETRDYVISHLSTSKVMDRFVGVTGVNSKPMNTHIISILELALSTGPSLSLLFSSNFFLTLLLLLLFF